MMRHISEIIGAQAYWLTVPHHEGQTSARPNHIVGAGFDSLTLEAHKSRATPAAFLCQYGSPYNGRAVREGAIPAGPLAGLSTRTVPPTRLTAGKRSSNTALEDSIMATATTKGAIRPKSTQSVQHANGTTGDIRWIREATCIKRLRRHLAKSGCSLHITREGSAERQRHGEYFIRDQDGQSIDDKINLESWLRAYDLLADDEKIDPPLNRGWLFYIGRYERVIVDGIEANYAKPITRTYTTEAAARKAVAHLTDREGLVMCSFDSTVRARYHAADEGNAND